MNIYKLTTFLVVSVIVAILLASTLNSPSARVADNALAELPPTTVPNLNAPLAITPAKRDYLPIIFLNAPTDGFWSLYGNAATNPSVHFLGTTDNVTLTFRVSNTVALRIDPTTGTPNIIGGHISSTVTSGVVGAVIGGGGDSNIPNRVTDNYGTVGGGLGNSAGNDIGAPGDAPYATVGGGIYNTASGNSATIGGGIQNTASGFNVTIGGGQTNRASIDYATIGGGAGNSASDSATTIGGGESNTASNNYATVGGGRSNTASGDTATVGGGGKNTASGAGAFVGGGGWDGSSFLGNQAQAIASTIGGGFGNIISPTSPYAAMGGGRYNTANGDSATVSGGYMNKANGIYNVIGGGRNNSTSNQDAVVAGGASNTASGGASFVAGGYLNVAQGANSFAAGTQAKANHNGAFVWADNNYSDLASTATNQFLVRASGGVTMYTNSAATAGAQLAPGSGSWSSLSDKNAKANFQTVDGRAILARVNSIPIQTWNYQTQDVSIRHIGPMAQDFYAAFNVGEDDRHISTVDADGVALAAIQGLNEIVQEKAAQMMNYELQVANYEARLKALEAQSSPNVWFVGAALLLVGIWLGRQVRRK